MQTKPYTKYYLAGAILIMVLAGITLGIRYFNEAKLEDAVTTNAPATAYIQGSEISRTIPELAELSDIVIRGTVAHIDESTRKLPVDNPEGTRPPIDVYINISTCSIEVAEYVKGSGSKLIDVFQSAPTDGGIPGDIPELVIGSEYVLFLFSTSGSEYWGDGYIIQGPTQGYWCVKDGNATRPLGEVLTMSIEELRNQITSVKR